LALLPCTMKNAFEILELFRTGSNPFVRRNACLKIAHMTSAGSREQIRDYVNLGFIEALVDGLSRVAVLDDSWAILDNSLADAALACAILDGLSNILKIGAEISAGGANRYLDMMEECNGSRMLEEIQKQENETVYTKAVELIKSYFEVEDDDQDDHGALQPRTNSRIRPEFTELTNSMNSRPEFTEFRSNSRSRSR